MGEKSQPSCSWSGKGTNAWRIKKANEPPVKHGGRILLPSKLKSVAAASSGGLGPLKSRYVKGAGRKSLTTRHMEDLYDSYVMDFVNLTIMKETEDIQEEDHLDTAVIKTIGVIRNSDVIVRTYVDKFVLKLWEDLKYTEKISGAFDNLLDFAGEELLIEIESLLVNKFGKITVEGAAVEESVFYDAKLKNVYNLVKNLTDQVERSQVWGFLQIFNETFNNLILATSSIKNFNMKAKSHWNTVHYPSATLFWNLARQLNREKNNNRESDNDRAFKLPYNTSYAIKGIKEFYSVK